MVDFKDLLRVEVFVDGKWKLAKAIGQIEKGDVFRLFNPDGTPIKNSCGNYSFIAVEEATILAESLP